jgi:hypothetical protein
MLVMVLHLVNRCTKMADFFATDCGLDTSLTCAVMQEPHTKIFQPSMSQVSTLANVKPVNRTLQQGCEA